MADEIESKEVMGSRVMVAIDGSDCSRYALAWALENLDQKFRTAGFILLTAVSVNFSGVYAGTYGAAPIDLMTSIQENERKFAASLLAKAKELFAKRGVDAETVCVIGDPKDAVCDAVEKFRCPLLVIGNHGRGALQRVFLGSVSNYCTNNAKCPVLIVKQPA